jgi:hypothetical protein
MYPRASSVTAERDWSQKIKSYKVKPRTNKSNNKPPNNTQKQPQRMTSHTTATTTPVSQPTTSTTSPRGTPQSIQQLQVTPTTRTRGNSDPPAAPIKIRKQTPRGIRNTKVCRKLVFELEPEERTENTNMRQ